MSLPLSIKWVDLTWEVGVAACDTARDAEDGRAAIIEDKPTEWNLDNTRIRLAREAMGVRGERRKGTAA